MADENEKELEEAQEVDSGELNVEPEYCSECSEELDSCTCATEEEEE